MGPIGGAGRLPGAGSLRVRLVALLLSSGLSLTGRAHHPWTVLTGHHGYRTPPTSADVRDDMATVPRRMEISVGIAHSGLAIPWKGEGVGFTVATHRPIPPDEGMGFVGAMGRLPMAGFSGSLQAGIGPS